LQDRALRRKRAWQLPEAPQSEALEELPRRPVEDRPARGLLAPALLDEPPRGERVDRLIAVHPADGLHLRASDRLAISDDGEGLERRGREPQAVGAEMRGDVARVVG